MTEIRGTPQPEMIQYGKWFLPFDNEEFPNQWHEFNQGKRSTIETVPYHLPDVGVFSLVLDKEISEKVKGLVTPIRKVKPGLQLKVRLTPAPNLDKQELKRNLLCFIRISNAQYALLGVPEFEGDQIVYQHWLREYYKSQEVKVLGKPRVLTPEELTAFNNFSPEELKISEKSNPAIIEENPNLIINTGIEFVKND